MNTMTLDFVSISSDEDDVPLNLVGSSQHVQPPICLKARSQENCEFCERVSYNKYDALVHNAKHIIIPLLKQEVHQCTLCLFYFTSRYKLKHHLRNKHKNDNVNSAQQTVVVKNENEKIKNDENNKTNGVVTKCETDDEDDLPLKVTQKLKLELNNLATEETEKCAVNHETDAMKEAREKLLKDVKVVLEKLHTEITDSIVPEKETIVSDHSKKVTHTETKVTHTEHNETSNHNKKVTHPEPKVTHTERNEILSNHDKKATRTNHTEHNETNNHNKKVTRTEPKVTHTERNELLNNHYINLTLDTPSKATNHSSVPDRPKAKISSRLTFEKDIDEIYNDEVIKDLTKDCLVDMNLFDQPWLNDLANSIAEDDLVNLEDDIILIDDDNDSQPSDTGRNAANAPNAANAVVAKVQENMDVDYSPSTHHDELIKPGVYRCKRCPDMFPTRFNQIQHEMHHIYISKPKPVLCEYCDRFFPTKHHLKTHLSCQHSTHYRVRAFKTCKKCRLKYSNYERHLEIYHVILRCHLCNETFETEVDRLNHIREHLIKVKCPQCDFSASSIEISKHQKLFHKACVSVSKTFNLCDMCCLFLRNKNNSQNVFGESVSRIGERINCEHCGKLFFTLTQVTRIGKGRPAGDGEKKKKARSNTERLKNIQQRLKMINKLSRVYL